MLTGPPKVGVCVTGEARSFRFAGIRHELRRFLHQISAVEVHMRIARATSACGGFEHARSSHLCESSKKAVFTMSTYELQREFPEAHIELLNSSSCAHAEQQEACCQKPCCSNPQSCSVHAFLQYAAISACTLRLLERSSTLTHIVRTRPDVLYLGSIEIGNIDQVTMIRKAEAGSMLSARTQGREEKQPGDWFSVVPVYTTEHRTRASRFLGSFVQRMREECLRGRCRLASSRTPELDWIAHGGVLQHQVALASFPLVVVYASSIPHCHRLALANCSLVTSHALFGLDAANDPWVAPPSSCTSPCEQIGAREAKAPQLALTARQRFEWRGKTLRIRGPRQKMGEAGFFVYALWALNAIDWASHLKLSYCCYLDGRNNPYWSSTRHPHGAGTGNLWTDFFEQPGARRCLALPEVMQLELSESDWRHGMSAGGWTVYRHRDALKTFPSGLCGAGCGSYSWYTRMRWRGATLVKQHLRPQREIRERVDSLWQEMGLHGRRVLGAHLRGTDKVWGTKVEPARYFGYFEQWLRHYGSDARILVATDDSIWLDEVRLWCARHHKSWCRPEQVVQTGATRSSKRGTNAFLDPMSGDPYQKGVEVLVDVLLLSRVEFLLKSTTNVAEFAIYFNATLIERR